MTIERYYDRSNCSVTHHAAQAAGKRDLSVNKRCKRSAPRHLPQRLQHSAQKETVA